MRVNKGLRIEEILNKHSMRSDAKKNLKKVATAKAKTPMATRDEIAKSAGVSQGTATKMLTELDEGATIKRTDRVVEIENKDLAIVEKAQGILNSSLDAYVSAGGELTPADARHISGIAVESQKRYSLFAGENTDKEGRDKETKIVVADKATADALTELTL